ncbi:hypothetical protein FRC02_001440 [Tulasnella sp. 418]|nr:hypothetical protein FRC02_001440 [Tulasnella sp. 418]
MRLLGRGLHIALLARCIAAATKAFSLDITAGTSAPDGVTREVFLINGKTPGDPLIATEGDDIEVTVINHVSEEATIHFHGIEMKGTPWSDGVPGVTMRMIPPGGTFIHRFRATQHGLYWYHAHSRALYGDGIRGYFLIHPSEKSLTETAFAALENGIPDIQALKTAHMNPKVLAAHDWVHWKSEYELSEWKRTRIEFLCVDSILINGKGRVICPTDQTLAPYLNNVRPELTVKGCTLPTNKNIQPFEDSKPELVDPKIFYQCENTTTPLEVIEVNRDEKWASVGLLNIGALWDLKFSIDDHPFYIYAADGNFHMPQKVDAVVVPPGERYTAMIRLDKPDGDYAIRVAVQATPQVISGYGVLTYNKGTNTGEEIPAANNPSIGYGGELLPGKTQLDPITLKSFERPPQSANVTLILNLKRTSSIEWALNHDPFSAFMEESEPFLFYPDKMKTIDQDLVPSYPVGSVVDVVLVSNMRNPQHPIHKHGSHAWVIGQGKGNFTWSSVAEAQRERPELFNLVNPPYRDGFLTLSAFSEPAFLVIRYLVTEPSATFMHCHINIHSYGGMAVVLMEDPEGIRGLQIPEYYVKWNAEAHDQEQARKRKGVARRSPTLTPRLNRVLAW